MISIHELKCQVHAHTRLSKEELFRLLNIKTLADGRPVRVYAYRDSIGDLVSVHGFGIRGASIKIGIQEISDRKRHYVPRRDEASRTLTEPLTKIEWEEIFKIKKETRREFRNIQNKYRRPSR